MSFDILSARVSVLFYLVVVYVCLRSGYASRSIPQGYIGVWLSPGAVGGGPAGRSPEERLPARQIPGMPPGPLSRYDQMS